MMGSFNSDDPMTQTEARMLARQLTESTGLIHIATAVPLGCWGGQEHGWDVLGPAGRLVTQREAERT